MGAYIAFIWTDKREVQGQWRYELFRSRAEIWAAITGDYRGFEYRKVCKSISEVKDLAKITDSPNAQKMLKSFFDYASRCPSGLFTN